MPYSAKHKELTRAKIIETARILFNRDGFQKVTIDMVMEEAGLTRGGFYNHFKNKEALFSAAVSSFLMGRGAKWRDEAGIDLANLKPEMAQHMIDAYLSAKHLGDKDGQCPMIALPSDVARASTDVQGSFQQLLDAMVWLFETNMPTMPTIGDAMPCQLLPCASVAWSWPVHCQILVWLKRCELLRTTLQLRSFEPNQMAVESELRTLNTVEKESAKKQHAESDAIQLLPGHFEILRFKGNPEDLW